MVRAATLLLVVLVVLCLPSSAPATVGCRDENPNSYLQCSINVTAHPQRQSRLILNRDWQVYAAQWWNYEFGHEFITYSDHPNSCRDFALTEGVKVIENICDDRLTISFRSVDHRPHRIAFDWDLVR